MFPTFDIFQQVFSELTEDFGCMVINNRIHSKNITDKVFWYKAKPTPEFEIGCNKFLKIHEKLYDENWNKKIAVYNTSMCKRNGIKLIVDKIK